MGLVFWWLLIVWLILGISFEVWVLIRKKKPETETHAVPIAHSNRLTDLPEYKKAVTAYRRLVTVGAISMTIALLAAIILSARPAAMTTIVPAQKGRDIMLCLDVSASLFRVDAKLVQRFREIVANFAGQRFGLTVFNSSSIAVIPLNNDYQYIDARLAEVGEALAKQEGQAFDDLTNGTLADFDKGQSLVGDGMASCINDLGDNLQKRSQSVILATDNESNGAAIISIDQATALAAKKGVRVYTVDPGVVEGERADDHEKLKAIAKKTGGKYFTLANDDAAADIIEAITKQEAKYAASTPIISVADKPVIPLVILMLVVGCSYIVMWRLRI